MLYRMCGATSARKQEAPLYGDEQCNTSVDLQGVFELAIRGDATALNDLFAPCLPQLQRTAARLLRNPQDSEDALQDGLLSAVRHLAKFEGRSQFSTWMHTIVINAARSILRKRMRHSFVLSLDEPQPDHEDLRLSDMLPDSRISMEESYARKERSRLLLRILRLLPPTHRSIIWLCDVEGLCIKDAARRLSLSISATKTRHLRATRFLLNAAKEARASRVPIDSVLVKRLPLPGKQTPDSVAEMSSRREVTPRKQRHWVRPASTTRSSVSMARS